MARHGPVGRDVTPSCLLPCSSALSPLAATKLLVGLGSARRFGDEKLCSTRMQEACRVVDELLGIAEAPRGDGSQPQLWQLGNREQVSLW